MYNTFTFRVIFAHMASIFTFSFDIYTHLSAFSHIEAFSHLRVPQACPMTDSPSRQLGQLSKSLRVTVDISSAHVKLVYIPQSIICRHP